MFKLIQRTAPPHRFKETRHETLDDAVWSARESDEDYLIEETPVGIAQAKVVRYRLGEFEMG